MTDTPYGCIFVLSNNKKTNTMATITFEKSEAKKISKKAYQIDRSGGLINGGKGFSGSVLTVHVSEGKTIVSSNYYDEKTLKSMFQ